MHNRNSGSNYGPTKIIGVDWGVDRYFVFDADRIQYRRRIYRVQHVTNFSIFDWAVGIFRSASRHLVSSSVLRHCWFDRYVALVLIAQTPSR